MAAGAILGIGLVIGALVLVVMYLNHRRRTEYDPRTASGDGGAGYYPITGDSGGGRDDRHHDSQESGSQASGGWDSAGDDAGDSAGDSAGGGDSGAGDGGGGGDGGGSD